MKRIVWLTISHETSGLYLERQEDCFFFVDFNLISQVSVRFFLVWQSDDDEILDYYIVKVVTIACEFRISINTTTVTFFYFLRFFCYFSQNNRNPWENNFFCVSRRPYVKPVNFFLYKIDIDISYLP